MQEIFKNFSQPSWWISVVVAGFFVSLLAAYTKPLLDKYLARFSRAIRHRSDVKNKERAMLVAELESDQSKILEKKVEAVDSKLFSVICLLILVGVLTFLKGYSLGVYESVFLTLLLLPIVVIVLIGLIDATRIHGLLAEVEERREKLDKQATEGDASDDHAA